MPGMPPPGRAPVQIPFRIMAAFLAAFLFLMMWVLQANAQAMPEHDGHQWLQNKKTPTGQSCCTGGQSGDCQPVPFDGYTVDAKGGVHFGNHYFAPDRVFPTEDHHGRPFVCIFNGQARCAFIPQGV